MSNTCEIDSVCNIDELFSMLSYSNSEDTQNRAIDIAKNIKHISVFFQPVESKSTWENCARIIVSKSDSELERYLIPMLQWLKDMNWPGANLIYDRIKLMPSEFIRFSFEYCYKLSVQTNDMVWTEVLKTLQ